MGSGGGRRGSIALGGGSVGSGGLGGVSSLRSGIIPSSAYWSVSVNCTISYRTQTANGCRGAVVSAIPVQRFSINWLVLALNSRDMCSDLMSSKS